MQLMHIGFVILIIAAVQNYYYIHVNKSFLPEYLLRLKILPPRSFQSAGGASQHRLFFLHSTKGLTFNVPMRSYIADTLPLFAVYKLFRERSRTSLNFVD